MPNNIFAKKSIKRGSYVCKTVHKAIIIVAETRENLQFFSIGTRSPLLNFLSFLRIGLNRFGPLDMTCPKDTNSVRPILNLVDFPKRELD